VSDESLVFFTNPQSRGRIVHWMLEELGVPYETKIIDLAKGEHKQAPYLAVNPMGKVPAIRHRGVVVTESAAICAYLADAFPAARLAPALESPQRGPYLRWLFFGAGCIEAATLDHAFPRKESPRPGMLGYGSYEDTVRTLEQALQGEGWIAGAFSAADVYIGSQIGWGLFQKSLDPRPAFLAYVQRCNERPAYQRMMEQTNRLIEAAKGA
jgi:glutathione S-transferase